MKMEDQYSESGVSNWPQPKADPQYDPSDVELYRGKTFIAGNGKEYRITPEGKFSGRESIEGAEVMLIAGINKQIYMVAAACLTPKENKKAKAYLDEIIFKYGQEPREGLGLVISLTPASSKEKQRNGMIIPSIKKIK